ncbi:hypothetical protein Q8A73_014345 [Channa argus]|nr:hypothetical protein Q8A73_014345 [Channa argus]
MHGPEERNAKDLERTARAALTEMSRSYNSSDPRKHTVPSGIYAWIPLLHWRPIFNFISTFVKVNSHLSLHSWQLPISCASLTFCINSRRRDEWRGRERRELTSRKMPGRVFSLSARDAHGATISVSRVQYLKQPQSKTLTGWRDER